MLSLPKLAGNVLFLVTLAHASVDWELYHKTDEILDYFKAAARQNPGRARYEEIQDPGSQFRLPVVTITEFASGTSGKEIILLIAGEHARELVTAEIVFWLGCLLIGERQEEFLEWASTQPVQATAWRSGWTKGTLSEWADHILKKVVFKILPVQNIAGRKAVEGGTACLRKTISGVDLNRNWPYAWQAEKLSADEYSGTKPFSEPETRIVQLVAENTQPQAFVNLHSGEWAMYVPWDSQKAVAPDLPADTGDLLEKMNAYCECMKGAAGEVAGYLAQGTSMDYMYAEQHVPYPLTFEVYGPKGLGKLAHGGHPRRALETDKEEAKIAAMQQDTADSCFDFFNPGSRESYEATVAGWVGALLVLADHLILFPHASSARHAAEQQQLPEPEPPPVAKDAVRLAEVSTTRGATKGTLPQDTGRVQKLSRKSGGLQLSTAAAPQALPLGSLSLSAIVALSLVLIGVMVAVWMRTKSPQSRQSKKQQRMNL